MGLLTPLKNSVRAIKDADTNADSAVERFDTINKRLTKNSRRMTEAKIPVESRLADLMKAKDRLEGLAKSSTPDLKKVKSASAEVRRLADEIALHSKQTPEQAEKYKHKANNLWHRADDAKNKSEEQYKGALIDGLKMGGKYALGAAALSAPLIYGGHKLREQYNKRKDKKEEESYYVGNEKTATPLLRDLEKNAMLIIIPSHDKHGKRYSKIKTGSHYLAGMTGIAGINAMRDLLEKGDKRSGFKMGAGTIGAATGIIGLGELADRVNKRRVYENKKKKYYKRK